MMGLKKNYKLFNFYVFILILPLLIFASQEAFASSGDIHTYAGLGNAGFSGDGGQATAARLSAPSCVASDAAGNLYISDRANQRIRKIDTAGRISTIAGVGAAGYSGDGGTAILAKLNNPSGIAVDSAGNVFFADMGNNRIRKISASGTITTLAGTGAARFTGDGGPAASAAVNHAEGIAVDSKGDIYVSDTGNNRVRMIDATGIIKTVAGTGAAGFAGDGGPAISAKLNRPVGIALDAAGKLYIADCYNQRVRVVSSGGITTLAGDGTPGLSGDGGHAMSASLRFPSGVSVTAAGTVYIADWHNQGVRVVNTSGTINTLAGTGVAGFSGDGAAAGNAGLRYPFGLTTDSKGNIFVADSKNNRVRMIEGPSYALPVSTIASPVTAGRILSGSSGLTVTGTASAADGVSFVEVSTDGGTTWGTASGTTTWNYKWTPAANGAYLIMSRAADSSGAHETIISCSYVNVLVVLAPPGSKIMHPKNGANLTASKVVVNGVAAHGKGCGLAKVEVSTDGGTTWNTAKGASLWSYSWTPPQNGSYTIKTRATDKAGNVEAPGTGVNVTFSLSATGGPTPAPNPNPTPTPRPTPTPSPTGNSYYMAPTGSDSNSGTISSPWKTWASASKKLKAGDTLYARGGTYTGQGSSSNGSANWYSPSGTQAAPVTFKAYPGEVPVFDGQMSVVSGLTLSNVSWIVIDGLTFTRYSGDAGIMCGNWGAGNVSNVTIQNCVVHDSGLTLNQDHAMYLSAGCSNFIVRNNFLYNCVNGAGIQCWHSPGMVNIQIYNNVIYNNHWGIVMGDGATGLKVYNNAIDKCYIGVDWGQTGETVLTGVVNAISKNNIITNSSYCGMRVGSFDSTQVTSDYNLYYGNATDIIWSGSNYSLAGYKSAHPGEQHSVSANPSYASSTGNYRLNSGSPAIGAGTPQTLFNTTITGATRSSWDIGPY